MTIELAKEAAKDLGIRDVRLGNHAVKVYVSAMELSSESPAASQFRWGARRLDTSTVRETGTDNLVERLATVVFYGGARLIKPNEDGTLPDTEAAPDQLVAEFNAEFLVTVVLSEGSEPTAEALAAFARYNVRHIVWPWLREWLATTSTRMGFPTILLPLTLMGPEKAEGAKAKKPENPIVKGLERPHVKARPAVKARKAHA